MTSDQRFGLFLLIIGVSVMDSAISLGIGPTMLVFVINLIGMFLFLWGK